MGSYVGGAYVRIVLKFINIVILTALPAACTTMNKPVMDKDVHPGGGVAKLPALYCIYRRTSEFTRCPAER